MTNQSANALLAATTPEEVFPDNFEGIKQKYIELVRVWHPDRCTDPLANAVMMHITSLRDAAEKKLLAGLWMTPNALSFMSIKGQKYRFNFRRVHTFPLGKVMVGSNYVLYMIKKEFEPLLKKGISNINALTYKDEAMEKSIAKYLPTIHSHIEGLDNSFLLLKKTGDVYLLRDVLNYFNGKIPPKHVAWIISSLLNIVCYLSWAGVSHQNISVDTVFVSPKHHSIMLLGGWWYAAPIGSSLAGSTLPAGTVALMSSKQRRDKVVRVCLDQDAVRAVAREILGEGIARLVPSKELPAELISWVRTIATVEPVRDYDIWKNSVLPACFGPPKFHKLELTDAAIYQKEG